MDISEEILTIHRTACESEEAGYMDPETGLFVLTSFHLQNRGYCCGNGCRHCPFTEEDWEAAGRPNVPCYPHPKSS